MSRRPTKKTGKKLAKRTPRKVQPKKPGTIDPEQEWIDFDLPAPYIDVVKVIFSERNFLLAFGQAAPYKENFKTMAKVALHPKTVVELLMLLVQQISKYEDQFDTQIDPERFRMALEVSAEVFKDA